MEMMKETTTAKVRWRERETRPGREDVPSTFHADSHVSLSDVNINHHAAADCAAVLDRHRVVP